MTSVSARPLGVAVAGLGVGEQHARAYTGSARCRLRTLFDLDRRRAETLAAELGGVSVASSFAEVVCDPTIDVVSIASYDDAHFEQAVAALGARKHVFVEKPLCRSFQELRQIQAAWRASGGLHLATNLVLRGAPLYQWLRDAIRDGELGEVYAFDGDYLYGRLEKITDGWRRDVDDYSVVQGGAVHLVDLMLWTTGQRPSTVSATGNRIASRGTAFRYDDYVSAVYRFDSGAIGRITANFGCVHPHQHVVRVFGTRGTFIHDDRGPRLHRSRTGGAAAVPLDLSPEPGSKGDLIPLFVEAILARCDASAGAQREFDTMAACLAADEALRSGGAIEVAYH